MKLHRKQRMEQLIRDALAAMILRELEFDNTLLTLTEVEVSSDLKHAKIKVSVIPGNQADHVVEILNKRKPHLQYELLKKLNIIPLPEIHFIVDHGLENAAAVEKNLL